MYLSVGSRPRVTRWGTEKLDVILDPFGWSTLLSREGAACHLQPPMSPTHTALSAVLGRGSGTVGVTMSGGKPRSGRAHLHSVQLGRQDPIMNSELWGPLESMEDSEK